MPNTAETLLEKIRLLQDEFELELARRREAFRYRLENGRVVWEEEARRQHRALRVRWLAFLRRTRPLTVITTPVIYSLIIPFVLLDIFVTIYHANCPNT